MKAKLVLCTKSLNEMHITSDGIVFSVLIFGYIADMTKIV